jgi:reactive intermediate/imine deaminase
MKTPSIVKLACLVPGNPQILLTPERNAGWERLHQAYGQLRSEIESVDADLILYLSTQWMSVIGHLFQADPAPEWVHVDPNWHELGSLPYRFRVDADFGKAYCQELKNVGAQAATVNYRGFPIDTGTIVAQKLLNPENHLPAAMVSCNIYIERDKTQSLGRGGARALLAQGKSAVVVLVSNLSQRQFTRPIEPTADRIYSLKDDEWNRKVLDLLEEGRLEDVDQCAREFAREAGADMGGKGFWWLNGLCGQHNHFTGRIHAYEPVWGAGAAVVSLTPSRSIREPAISGLTEGERRYLGLPSDDEDADIDISPRIDHIDRVDSTRAPEPVGAYPHARRYGDFLLLSGVGPRQRGSKEIPGVTLDEYGKVVDYDIRVQTRAVIENIRAILEEAGSSLENVIDITVFLTNMENDFAAYNEVYAEHFKDIGPTRTTLGITALPTPIHVEFKVLAKP